MRWPARLPILALLIAQPGSARAAADLCDAIEAFERAPLAVDAAGRKLPRSVELFWQGPWGIENLGYECRHDEDAARKALCWTLINSMPQEFRLSLIFRILRCYGYRLPGSVWREWQSEITLVHGDDYRLRLDVNMSVSDGSRDALRLSKLPHDFGWRGETLPPLKKPLPPSAGRGE
jgi:hypothetical protein